MIEQGSQLPFSICRKVKAISPPTPTGVFDAVASVPPRRWVMRKWRALFVT